MIHARKIDLKIKLIHSCLHNANKELFSIKKMSPDFARELRDIIALLDIIKDKANKLIKAKPGGCG
jgi:hypothetical protein